MIDRMSNFMAGPLEDGGNSRSLEWERAETLYQKVRWGGVFRLISHDGQVEVVMKVVDYAGVKGMALKRPSDKKFPKLRVVSGDDIIRYLHQFMEKPK